MSGKGKRRGGSSGGYTKPATKKPRTTGWSDRAANYRRAAMSSFMKNVWSAYPRKMSDAAWSAREKSGPLTISGLGDYRMRKGASIGSRIGAWLGDKAQGFLGRVTGLGDYTVRYNTLMQDPPSVRNNSARTVTLSHREYICDIISGPANTFSLQNFVINPGNSVTFPWLSGVASQFQQYRLDGVIFQFKSMSSDALNSTNTALGQVIMATNYDVNQPLFDSKYEMENTEFSTSVKPSLSAMHPIECARNESTLNELYVAPGGSVPTGGAPNMYNFGNFQIATNGFQASNVNIGELWVTYEVTLMKPILTSINDTAGLWTAYLQRGTFDSPGPFKGGNNWRIPLNTNNDALYIPSPSPNHDQSMIASFGGTGLNVLSWRPRGGGYFPPGTMFRITLNASVPGTPDGAAATGSLVWASPTGCAFVTSSNPAGVNYWSTNANGLGNTGSTVVVATTQAPGAAPTTPSLTLNFTDMPRTAAGLQSWVLVSIEQIREDTYDEPV